MQIEGYRSIIRKFAEKIYNLAKIWQLREISIKITDENMEETIEPELIYDI